MASRTTSIIQAVSSIPGKKIVSYGGLCGGRNFDMQDSYITTTDVATLDRLWRREKVVGITVRQFTSRTDEASGLPVKQLYGFVATNQGVTRLSPQQVQQDQETDFHTGMRLPREVAVEYV